MTTTFVLIGPSGAGKTSVGKQLASLLPGIFIDTDQLIEAQTNLSTSDIFTQKGESEFRRLEKALITRLIEDKYASEPASRPLIVATGGGLPCQPDMLELLSQLGTIIFLNARIECLVTRLKDDYSRPLLTNKTGAVDLLALQKSLGSLLTTRLPIYERAPYKIETSGHSPQQVAIQLIQILNLVPAIEMGTRE